MTDTTVEALVRSIFDIHNDHGDEWDALCPVHQDSNPSARVNVAKGVWYCHTCHEGGPIIKLAQELGHELPDAVSDWIMLGDCYEALLALQPPEEPTVYPEAWLARFSSPTTFWSDVRGFSQAAIDRFALGYDPAAQRATHAVRDFDGRILGVSARATQDGQHPKYKHPYGFRKTEHLFGAWESRDMLEAGPLPGVICLTEGALDAIALWDVGFAAVAQLGSELSPAQADLLQRLNPREIVLAYDADRAGRVSTIEAWYALEDCVLSQAVIPPGFDPGDLDIDERIEAVEQREVLLTEPRYRSIPYVPRCKRKTPAKRGPLRAAKP